MYPPLDRDAQPLIDFNAARRLDRDVHEMLGLCRGVLADGVVTEGEAVFLRDWIAARPHVTENFAGRELARRLAQIFADGRVDDDEREDLAELLRQLGQDQYGETLATTLPFDEPAPELVFTGHTYVFTGKFAFGPRKVCERAVMDLGALVAPSITKRTDVVVIGTFCSRDWAHTSFGRKIEKAVEYRESGIPLAIVGEDHWAAALP